MVKINKNFKKLASSYLFSEVARRTKAFSENNPGIKLLRLGIGNTTEPLSPAVIKGLYLGVEKLANAQTYTGYGDEQGDIRLRLALIEFYKKRGVVLSTQEVFISDGAKPDTANIQQLFSQDAVVAVQDPVYPVYVDTNVIAGRSQIIHMSCTEENDFVAQIPKTKVDIIYICSPNNPTGAVVTKKQLKIYVDYALKHKAIIIFDAAYSEYIRNKNVPKSIYEIKNAKKCAIEINSFSKSAGFTGVRLGWTIVPMGLVAKDAKEGELNNMWNRRQTTMFNGASNIVQEGGLAILSRKGQKECKKIIDYYMENAKIIKKGVEKIGLKTYGGENAPYIWVKTPASLQGGSKGMTSWDFFDLLLQKAHVVGTPGSGFGPSGEGYIRLSAFGHRENVLEAIESIQKNFINTGS